MKEAGKDALTMCRCCERSCVECYRPPVMVEPSAFSSVGDGRRPENVPFTTKVWHLMGAVVNKVLRVDQLEGYADGINYSMGMFLRCCAIVLYGYFIGSTYVTTANTEFISLDISAGLCKTVPVAITNTFILDSNGYWNGQALYNPSQGMYQVQLNSFNHTLDEYTSFMAYTNSVIQSQLVNKAQHNDLSQNLLNWVGWSLWVTEGNIKHRWTMTGDARTMLARKNYFGSLSKEAGDCKIPGTVKYRRATGMFELTYSYKDDVMAYSTDEDCKKILLPTDVGYDSVSNGDKFAIEWDGVSMIMARAVNKGVIAMDNLVAAKSGLNTQHYVVNGVLYTATNRFDDRYPDMQPIVCFKPNLASFAPSAAPSPFVLTTKVTDWPRLDKPLLCGGNLTSRHTPILSHQGGCDANHRRRHLGRGVHTRWQIRPQHCHFGGRGRAQECGRDTKHHGLVPAPARGGRRGQGVGRAVVGDAVGRCRAAGALDA